MTLTTTVFTPKPLTGMVGKLEHQKLTRNWKSRARIFRKANTNNALYHWWVLGLQFSNTLLYPFHWCGVCIYQTSKAAINCHTVCSLYWWSNMVLLTEKYTNTLADDATAFHSNQACSHTPDLGHNSSAIVVRKEHPHAKNRWLKPMVTRHVS